MNALRFDAAKHRYFIREGALPVDIELPSVTTVLKETNLLDLRHIPQDVLDHAAARGTAVHKALHYLDEGDLDPDSVDPAIAGYLDGYRRFCAETGFVPDRIEYRMYSPLARYAGTLDRTGWISNNQVRTILDFKTGIIYPAHGLQLAAYADCLPDSRSYRRIALKLNADGSFRAHEFPMSDYLRDSQLFRAALAVYNFNHKPGASK